MPRFFIALASIAITAAPLWTMHSAPPRPIAQAPGIIGLDKPIFLGRMTVTASPLPDDRL
ncbi:hypothetical protein [Sphingobium aquiterrae]|uniref:hypothetical protein n=1 Tax=Sphingobium aquiterrae TaxID=2038656 RepID=UPI0030170D1F